MASVTTTSRRTWTSSRSASTVGAPRWRPSRRCWASPRRFMGRRPTRCCTLRSQPDRQNIYFAILKYGGDDTPNLGEGPSTVKGIHHIGFYVDDLEGMHGTLEAAGCTECPGSSKVNRKFKG